jgi:hypothetical protein
MRSTGHLGPWCGPRRRSRLAKCSSCACVLRPSMCLLKCISFLGCQRGARGVSAGRGAGASGTPGRVSGRHPVRGCESVPAQRCGHPTETCTPLAGEAGRDDVHLSNRTGPVFWMQDPLSSRAVALARGTSTMPVGSSRSTRHRSRPSLARRWRKRSPVVLSG